LHITVGGFGLAVTRLSRSASYSTPGPVNTWMGDCADLYRAPHCTVMPLSTYGSLHQSPTSRPDKDFGLPPRTICAFLLSDCLLLDVVLSLSRRSCLERSSCRRHFSTFSVHFPKTFKTASLSTLLCWPCPLKSKLTFSPCVVLAVAVCYLGHPKIH